MSHYLIPLPLPALWLSSYLLFISMISRPDGSCLAALLYINCLKFPSALSSWVLSVSLAFSWLTHIQSVNDNLFSCQFMFIWWAHGSVSLVEWKRCINTEKHSLFYCFLWKVLVAGCSWCFWESLLHRLCLPWRPMLSEADFKWAEWKIPLFSLFFPPPSNFFVLLEESYRNVVWWWHRLFTSSL